MPEDTKNGGLEPADTSLPDSYKLPQTQSNNVRTLENSSLPATTSLQARTPRAHDTTDGQNVLPFDTSRFFGLLPRIATTIYYTVVADDGAPGLPFTLRSLLPGCPVMEQPGFATMPSAHRWAQQNYGGGQVAYVTPVAFSAIIGKSEAMR